MNTALALLGLCLLATRPPSDAFSFQPFATKLNHILLTSRDDALKAKLAEALNSRPPCRWEKHTVVVKDVPVEFVFDMGHNPAAIAALVRRTRAEYGHSSRPLRLVCGMARDKDVAACVASLATIFAESREVYFVKASYWRAMASADLWQLYFDAVPHAVRVERSQPSNGDGKRTPLRWAVSHCGGLLTVRLCRSEHCGDDSQRRGRHREGHQQWHLIGGCRTCGDCVRLGLHHA